jgi:hypothetical protein
MMGTVTARNMLKNVGKLVRLVGFIVKKFVTMHGHMNVKFFKPLLGAFA